ncbi:type II secretion system F family protein [Candidatus Viridilinea mediisalina]|uniref:Type II secretion system protein n=1 Tax=Candidatus Viridilinea mediisalina TaxID=2024553 RepID=A0A2A6RPG7_9CHLR|nr:type II secretion system F family protein [Candidatus Viridilinea mediisalina]PDW04825.1 type II secretion system protein [Candidatus Viridilinea mediisalina]
MDPMVILFGVIVLAGIGLLIFGLVRARQPDNIGERLTQFTERAMTLEELELQQPFYQRVLIPMAQNALTALGKRGPKQSAERLKTNLQMAGNPGNITPAMFVGLRVVLSLLLGSIVAALTFRTMELNQALLYSGVGFTLGYMLPVTWLGRKMKARQHSIQKALPDALDLLCISVEAGLAFDLALQRVTQKWDDELSREFKRVLADIRLGRTRREALKDLAQRTGVEDVQTFTAAIIQADQLGVSMSKILRLQSDQMRVRRRQRAEEQAQQAPVKMLFPMVFLIFPALFVVILGPAVPRLMDAFGG